MWNREPEDMALLSGYFLSPPGSGMQEMFMNKDQHELQRKLRKLRYAEESGHVATACRRLGIGRASFHR